MKKIIIAGGILLACYTTKAQVGINTTDPKAILDVTSTTSGFLKPRMTSAQRNIIAIPATGLEVYDTDTNSTWFYDGTQWVNTTSAGKPKRITFSPRYPSITIFSQNLGASSYLDYYDYITAQNLFKYYSYETTFHNITIALRVQIPSDFGSWDSINPIVLNYKTSNTTDAFFNYTIQKGTDVPVYTSSNLSNSNTWQTNITPKASLDSAPFSPNDYMIILINLNAQNLNNVQLADIVINYITK